MTLELDFATNGTCFAAMDYQPGQPIAFREQGTGRTVVAIATVPIEVGDIMIIDLVAKTAGLQEPHLDVIEGGKGE